MSEIIYKDGKIDEEQVLKELGDFSDMMHRFGIFLDRATGGRMSKLNYTEGAMIAELESYIEDCMRCEECEADKVCISCEC